MSETKCAHSALIGSASVARRRGMSVRTWAICELCRAEIHRAHGEPWMAHETPTAQADGGPWAYVAPSANARPIADQQDIYDMLREAALQIKYLHEKFQHTGSGETVLAQIEHFLAKSEGEA